MDRKGEIFNTNNFFVVRRLERLMGSVIIKGRKKGYTKRPQDSDNVTSQSTYLSKTGKRLMRVPGYGDCRAEI